MEKIWRSQVHRQGDGHHDDVSSVRTSYRDKASWAPGKRYGGDSRSGVGKSCLDLKRQDSPGETVDVEHGPLSRPPFFWLPEVRRRIRPSVSGCLTGAWPGGERFVQLKTIPSPGVFPSVFLHIRFRVLESWSSPCVPMGNAAAARAH